MDPILAVMEFILDNIGAVVGVLIIVSGMVSAHRKAKRAQEERKTIRDYREEHHGEYEAPVFEEPQAKPKGSLFSDLMAELEESAEKKPWEISVPEERPAPQKPTVAASLPKKPLRAAAAPAKPLPPEVSVPGDLTASKGEKDASSAGKSELPKIGNELMTAVVMSEVLAKPKGLRDEII